MLSGKSRYPEHLPFLSRAASIFWVGLGLVWQECFDPIVATSGCDLIPIMVYGYAVEKYIWTGVWWDIFCCSDGRAADPNRRYCSLTEPKVLFTTVRSVLPFLPPNSESKLPC
uniref:Uncharacterized protein n=1 Tax=Lactuca sativa TaxID=4236 RepID=A0A9R1VMH9_LACSA|nr:hypothetical protein LSAT_V11C500233360 [Lactuca sativa]